MSKERDLDITPLTRSPLPVSPFDDIAEGPGVHVTVGEGSAQIFPVSRVARAELAGTRARMTDLTHLTVEEAAITAYSETETHQGTMRLDAQSLVVGSVEKESEAAVPQPVVEAEIVEPEVPASDGVQAETPGEAAPEYGEKDRVRLTGRIGYKPRFRDTAKGTRVGQFALASHEQPGETSWHSIVAFGDRATRLEEAGFGKGDEIEVIGYPHERERTNPKTGETKTVTEIYAAVVKKVGARETKDTE